MNSFLSISENRISSAPVENVYHVRQQTVIAYAHTFTRAYRQNTIVISTVLLPHNDSVEDTGVEDGDGLGSGSRFIGKCGLPSIHYSVLLTAR